MVAELSRLDFSTVRGLSSQAVSSACDALDVVERPTVRLQRVYVENIKQYRTAVIAVAPNSLASLHVAEESGRLESGSDHACLRIQES